MSPWRRASVPALSIALVVALAWDYRRTADKPTPPSPPALGTVEQTGPAQKSQPSEEPREQAVAPPEALPLATPAPAVERLPTASCPLSQRGYGAPPSRDRIRSDWYTRADSYAYAGKEQLAAAAPMLVYVFTEWCQFCRAFERELLSSSTVDRYLREHAVKVKFNPETGDAEQRLADQLGVTGYPSLYVASPGGRSERISPYVTKTQLQTPEAFVALIEERVKGDGAGLARLGGSQRQAKQLDKAIATLTLALRLIGEDEWTFLERGRAFAESGAFDDALDDFARVARARPEDPEPVHESDALLAGKNRLGESIACWTSFLERNPSSGRAYLARSQALERLGAKGLSHADAEKACRLGEAQGCRRVAESGPR